MKNDLFVKTATAPVATTANVKPFVITATDTEFARLMARKGKPEPKKREESPWTAVLLENGIGTMFPVISSVNPESTINNAIQNLNNRCKAMVKEGLLSPRHLSFRRNYRRPLLDANGKEIPVLDKDGKQAIDAKGFPAVERVPASEEVVLAMVFEGLSTRAPRKAKEGAESAGAPAPAESATA